MNSRRPCEAINKDWASRTGQWANKWQWRVTLASRAHGPKQSSFIPQTLIEHHAGCCLGCRGHCCECNNESAPLGRLKINELRSKWDLFRYDGHSRVAEGTEWTKAQRRAGSRLCWKQFKSPINLEHRGLYPRPEKTSGARILGCQVRIWTFLPRQWRTLSIWRNEY